MEQAVNYVLNNRHNGLTAHYYLLGVQMERSPGMRMEEERDKDRDKEIER